MEQQHQRRETDQLSHRLSKWSGIVISLGVLGTALMFVAAMFFQTVKDAQACESRFSAKVEKVEVQQNCTEKAMVEIKTDIKYIRESIDELKRR